MEFHGIFQNTEINYHEMVIKHSFIIGVWFNIQYIHLSYFKSILSISFNSEFELRLVHFKYYV